MKTIQITNESYDKIQELKRLTPEAILNVIEESPNTCIEDAVVMQGCTAYAKMLVEMVSGKDINDVMKDKMDEMLDDMNNNK